MNQIKETKFGLKSLPILLCVAALLCGAGIVLIRLFWLGLGLVNGPGLYTVIHQIGWIAGSVINVIVLPLLLMFCVISFHKKGKIGFLLPATFGGIALYTLIYEFFVPLLLNFLSSVTYGYSLSVASILSLILVGESGISFINVLTRLMNIGVLVWFAVGAVLAFMKRRTNFMEMAFKGATVLGAISSVLFSVVDIGYSVYWVFDSIDYLDGIDIFTEIAYDLFFGGATFFFMAALVIFVLMKKPAAPVEGEGIQSV